MTTLLLYNGSIYTLNPAQPHATALAIRDDRVLAVGDLHAVRAATGRINTEIDLAGRAVIPGLTDAHVHFTWHGFALQRVRLSSAPTLEAALECIAKKVATLPPGAWLQGGGWNHGRWTGRWPTRADLDRVCPDHPAILVRRDGHSIWVNSQALALAGVDDTTPDPPDGVIQRDSQGRATGILLEGAQELVRRVVPTPTPAERLAALRLAQAEALSYGLTSLHIPPSPISSDGRETMNDLQILYNRGELQLRCLAHLAYPDLDAALALGLRSGLGDDWLRIGGLKIFADGSLGSETAEMLDPYTGRTSRGIAMFPEAELNMLIQRAYAGGISVVVHAIGDAANRKVLDAIARTQQQLEQQNQQSVLSSSVLSSPTLPNRIEHAQVLHPEDIERFARLGVVASMQPAHATSDMQVAERLWGARCKTAYAWQALRSAGTMLAFGSDAPVEPLNPWRGIHAAVTRQRIDSTPEEGWYPEQRLSLADTLHACCIGPAVASGEAGSKGMLAPGMLADLAILAVDPFTIQPEDLHAVTVDMTIVGGKVLFQHNP
ncbi:MAG: amidohydrolase [Chloroflexaceae bacterium]